jgi:pyruvate,orthophosphate dikinase
MSSTDDLLYISGSASSPLITSALAGSKAAKLWLMAKLGLDVPPAFVLPTTLCAGVNARDGKALEALETGLAKGMAWLEKRCGRRFGDSRAPLLVSVRSGAPLSMPGMLKTVLDIGLNEESVHGLIRLSGNPRLAFDSYRRLIQSYAEVVGQKPSTPFDRSLASMVARERAESEAELDSEALERLSTEYHALAIQEGCAPPEDPREQLLQAARAVFQSWLSARAVEYRRLNRLEDLPGTSVTVQAMVFGNSGARSGSGVVFSRNPATGDNELYLDFLIDAQGEDVVSGRRTPIDAQLLQARLPHVARQLVDGVRRIEGECRDAQDVEFVVEDGHLYFLQTRTAKRTPLAALRIAVAMAHEGLIGEPTALARVAELDPSALAMSHFAEPAPTLATAISAGPGVASGRAVFDSQRATELAKAGEPVILVRPDTSTEDIAGLAAAIGILTSVGGRTAHAAVVARQLGKICLVGCHDLAIDELHRKASIGDTCIAEGDWLSLDGDAGLVTLGKRSIVSQLPSELSEIEIWRRRTAQGEGRVTA